jgi:hypothetical protein
VVKIIQNLSNKWYSLPIEKAIPYLLVFTCIALSLIQFAANRSLWLDEAALALNILDKSYLGLLKPLADGQVAPPAFLWIGKFFSQLWPGTDYGLRVWPLINYVLATILFLRLSRRILENAYARIFALSLWVFNTQLLYYSSEVKQYMGDVTICIAILWLVLRHEASSRMYFGSLIVVGIIAITLSNVAIIVLTATGFYLLTHGYWQTHKKALIWIGTAWICTFLIYYTLFVMNHPSKEYMLTFWSNKNGFLRGSLWNVAFYKDIYNKMIHLIGLYKFDHKINVALGLFAFVGLLAVATRRHNRSVLLLLVLPLIIHLLLSYLKLYPFFNRLILYTTPLIILLSALGVEKLINLSFSDLKINRFRLLAVIIPLLILSADSQLNFPIEKDEIKQSVIYIAKNKKPSEKVYVYFTANLPVQYYEKQGFLRNTSDWITGTADWSNRTACIDEILLLEGKVWLLFSHVREKDKTLLLSALKKNDILLLDTFETAGSSTYLYDFTTKITKTTEPVVEN